MQINFISSLDSEDIRVMDSKSKNVEILMGDETDDIIKEVFKFFKQTYQERLEKKVKGSDFAFKNVELYYYSLHKTRLRRGKSYIESPEWLKNKKVTINSQNEDDNSCFQYAITVALNHQNSENHSERISNIKSFINKYNWKDIYFPEHRRDPKKFKQEDWEKLKKIIWKLTGKSSNKIISQLLLIAYLYHTIQKQ